MVRGEVDGRTVRVGGTLRAGIATDNTSTERYKGSNDQRSSQTPALAGPVSRAAEQAARARDAFASVLARRDAQGRDGRIWSQRGRSEGDSAGLLVTYEASAEDAQNSAHASMSSLRFSNRSPRR